MNLVIPLADILGLLRGHAPETCIGHPPFALETMLRFRRLLEAQQLSAAHRLATLNAELNGNGLLLRPSTGIDSGSGQVHTTDSFTAATKIYVLQQVTLQ